MLVCSFLSLCDIDLLYKLKDFSFELANSMIALIYTIPLRVINNINL